MTDKGIEQLAKQLRDWAERPTALTAAAARTRVLAHLERRPKRPTWRLAAASAALAASALALVLLIGRREPPVVSGSPSAAAAPQQQMIVHQLSSGTKLYVVVEPAATADEC